MRSLALTIALLAAAPVQANTVYNWQTVSASETITSATGRIEFVNDWTNYEHEITCVAEKEWCDVIDPDSPVARFQFGVNGRSIDLSFHTGEGWLYDVPGLRLAGDNIYANTGGMDTFLSADSAGLWTIDYFGSDDQMCGDPMVQCHGATGRWTLEQVAAVPLPGTLALIGLGLLAVPLRARKPVTPQA